MLLSHLKYLLKESGIDCPCQAQTKQTGLRGDVGVEVRLASFIFHVHHIHWQILDSGLEHQTLQLDIGLWTNRLQTVSSETSSTVVLNTIFIHNHWKWSCCKTVNIFSPHFHFQNLICALQEFYENSRHLFRKHE